MNLDQLGVGRPDFVQRGITRAGFRRVRGFRRLLGGVGGLRLLDFVRLLVHVETVSRQWCDVNGAEVRNLSNRMRPLTVSL